MAFKINLSTKDGKTFKIEAEANALVDKQLGDKIDGKLVSPDLEAYELQITGASDKSGFTAHEKVEGMGKKKLLLSYEKAMHKRPKHEGKTKRSNKNPKGLRLRKTVRGKTISSEISQINLKVLKQGNKKLTEIFPEQNKAPEPEKSAEPEAPKETTPAEQPKEEVKTKETKSETPQPTTENQQQKTPDESLTTGEKKE